MKLDAILCNHAETANNLLFVSGGGINVANVRAGAPAPYGVNLAFGLIVTVPWEEVGNRHAVHIELFGDDGQPTVLPSPPSTEDAATPFWFDLGFNAEATPTQTEGDDQVIALAANLVGLPFPKLGKYEFVLSIAGREHRRIPFRVQAAAAS